MLLTANECVTMDIITLMQHPLYHEQRVQLVVAHALEEPFQIASHALVLTS